MRTWTEMVVYRGRLCRTWDAAPVGAGVVLMALRDYQAEIDGGA